MSTPSFLLGYLRRYTFWGGLSLLSIAAYFLTSVAMIAMIKPVFEQVMPTDLMNQEDLGLLKGLDIKTGDSSSSEASPTDQSTAKDGAAPESPLPTADSTAGPTVSNQSEGQLAESPTATDTANNSSSTDNNVVDALEEYFSTKRDWLFAAADSLYQSLERTFGVAPENRLFRPQYFAAILFVLVFSLRSLCSFLSGYTFQRIGFGITTDIRNDLYNFLLIQSSEFHSNNPSGKLFSRVINDVGRMQSAFTNRLVDLFQQSTMLVICMVVLFMLDAKMAFVCLIAMPLIVYPVVHFGRGMFKTSHRSQERMEDLAELLTEGIRGNRVVKAFGMENFELTKFKAATSKHLAVNLRAQMLASASSPVIESLAALGGCTLLVFAGGMIRRGELTSADFMTFLALLFMLYDPIRKLNKVNIIVQEALAAADRVKTMLSIPISIKDDPSHEPLQTVNKSISFDRVCFSYGEKQVLKSFTLTVRAGEVVALVGASGAGKSTVVNLLPRFFDPNSGVVSIDDIDVRDLPLQNLRSLIGLVTQDTMLFNDSVRNNIAYGRSDLPLDDVRKAAQAAYANDFVLEMKSGYETVIGEAGHQLSGGQRQRLAIARALLKDAPILILDEATSHLDSESELLVQQAVHNLMKGRTALIIAHRLSTVTQADRILVMKDGEIVEEGDHETLLGGNGPYKKLYDLQFRSP